MLNSHKRMLCGATGFLEMCGSEQVVFDRWIGGEFASECEGRARREVRVSIPSAVPDFPGQWECEAACL